MVSSTAVRAAAANVVVQVPAAENEIQHAENDGITDAGISVKPTTARRPGAPGGMDGRKSRVHSMIFEVQCIF
jgi:hypothetical protein